MLFLTCLPSMYTVDIVFILTDDGWFEENYLQYLEIRGQALRPVPCDQ